MALLLWYLLCLYSSQLTAAAKSAPVCITEISDTHSPDSSLPKYDETLLSHPLAADFEREYLLGMERCEMQYTAMAKKMKDQRLHPPLTLGKSCRGVRALFQMTNKLIMPFGPTDCEINSQCWVGVLACGKAADHLMNVMELHNKKRYGNRL